MAARALLVARTLSKNFGLAKTLTSKSDQLRKKKGIGYKALGTVGAAVGAIASAFGFKKGGLVKKTGVYKLHKGERVLSVKQTKAYNRLKRNKKRKKRKKATKKKGKKR